MRVGGIQDERCRSGVGVGGIGVEEAGPSSAQRWAGPTLAGSEYDVIARQGTAKVTSDRCLERGEGGFSRPPRWFQAVERAEGDLGGVGERVSGQRCLLSGPNPTGAVRIQVNLSPSLSLVGRWCSSSNSKPSPHSNTNTCTSLRLCESRGAWYPSFLR